MFDFSEQRPEERAMEPKTILIADDDDNDVELTLTALADHHLANQVIVVRDGAEALDYLHRRGAFAQRPEGNPVLILLDLKMPKVDGLEVLAQVKKAPELRTIPIVVLTSSRQDADILNSYELGVNGYAVKPVDFAQFVEVVKQLSLYWTVVNEPPPQAHRPS
jgi:CheY-like chemotaxis protein